MAECDENLCQADLSPSERALFTQRRKEAYEQIRPETKHGGNRHSSSRKVCDLNADRFTADTAARTGKSERAVQLDARRGQIDPHVLSTISGTALDKGVVLDEIAATPRQHQKAKVQEITERRASKTVPAPREADSDTDIQNRQIDRLMAAWNAAGPDAREAFIKKVMRKSVTMV